MGIDSKRKEFATFFERRQPPKFFPESVSNSLNVATMIALYGIYKSHSVHCFSSRMKRKQDESYLQARSLKGVDNVDAVGKSPPEFESKENRPYSNIDDINISTSGIYLKRLVRSYLHETYILYARPTFASTQSGQRLCCTCELLDIVK